MQAAVGMMTVLFSVLVPQKMWYAPNQGLNVTIQSEQTVTLVLTDFLGKPLEGKGNIDNAGGTTVNIKSIFPILGNAGTYILWAVPKGGTIGDFLGTPLVIESRADRRPAAPVDPIVYRVEPLRYAVMTTAAGPMTLAFYYDSAPDTVDNFLSLAQGGFYDGLTFHRIVTQPKPFIIQGGDPEGNGEGGPGYHLEAEFNDRPHEAGVISMARNVDRAERLGSAPRPEFANSAGSQFFICLDYGQTRSLDGRYSDFGKIVDGMGTVDALAKTPVEDPQTGKPTVAPSIDKVEVLPVTAGHNPYSLLFAGSAPGSPGVGLPATTQP